jgi:hypothetical protein
MKNAMVRGAIGVSLTLVLAAGVTAAARAAAPAPGDAGAMCADMMREATPEGRDAMREFMRSDRAPEAMAPMMEMAGRMGGGDPMLGMTRMMEMMGSMGQGGMRSGHGDMMTPGPALPGR